MAPPRARTGNMSPSINGNLHNNINPTAPFTLANTRESYRDLLIFEERLKQNAARLAGQRRKYEAFLLSLVLSTVTLAYKVVLAPSPYNAVQFALSGLLLVAIVTLVLFFATGVYSEKIAYAYKFVPQANRALRYFNIYLNTKRPPRSWSLSPLRLFTSTTISKSAPTSNGTSATTSARTSRSASPTSSPSTVPRSGNHRARSTGSSPLSSPTRSAIPLAPLPPSQNPRGELVFSSRVTPAFREGYERYRAEWERRRKPTRKERSWYAKVKDSLTDSSSTVSQRTSEGTKRTPSAPSADGQDAGRALQNVEKPDLRKSTSAVSIDSISARIEQDVNALDGRLSTTSFEAEQQRGRPDRKRTISLTRLPVQASFAPSSSAPVSQVHRSASSSSLSSAFSITFSSSATSSRRPSPFRREDVTTHPTSLSAPSSPSLSEMSSRPPTPDLPARIETRLVGATTSRREFFTDRHVSKISDAESASDEETSPRSESVFGSPVSTDGLSLAERRKEEMRRRHPLLSRSSESSLATSLQSDADAVQEDDDAKVGATIVNDTRQDV
ncbi:hypothetical protein EMMF5_004446 [Cystobasidiomycetes sp. EMM_F5]